MRLILLMLCVMGAWSLPVRGALGPSVASEDGHSWIVAPHPLSGELVLHHLPPGRLASREGQVTVARRLSSPPVAMAASGNEVFLALSAPEGEEPRVYSLRAVAGAAGSWQFVPGGRLRRLPSLPEGALSVRSLAASDGVVYAIDDLGASILRLDNNNWEVVADADGAAELVRTDAGIARLVRTGAGTLGLIPVDGSESDIIYTGADPEERVLAWSGELIGLSVTGDGWRVRRFEESGPRTIGEVSGVPPTATAVVRSDRGRISWVWRIAEDAGESESEGDDGTPTPFSSPGARWQMVELSLSTGREVYRGGAGPALPVNADDFRVLAFVLFVFTTLVLIGSLGPRAADQVLSLPAGWVLASPGRRGLGWLIDAVPGGLVAVLVFGVGAGVAFADQLAGVLTGLAVSHTLAAATEAAIGTSLGKLLAGCRVVSVDPADAGGRIGFGRAFTRNIGRWMLLPVGVAGVLGRERRHIGDLWSRSAVVVSIGEADRHDRTSGGVDSGGDAQQ